MTSEKSVRVDQYTYSYLGVEFYSSRSYDGHVPEEMHCGEESPREKSAQDTIQRTSRLLISTAGTTGILKYSP